MVGVATWGSRIRDNPRLREGSPASKFCVSEVVDGANCVSEPLERREGLNPVHKTRSRPAFGLIAQRTPPWASRPESHAPWTHGEADVEPSKCDFDFAAGGPVGAGG